MNKAVDTTEYRGLSDETINRIVTTIKKLPYSEKDIEKHVLPYIAQWLYDQYVNIESTCLIISSLTNMNRLQEKVDNIYERIIPPLPAKSKLNNFLTQSEYHKLERAIEPRIKEGTITGTINETTNIIVNFNTKQVLQEKISFKRDGTLNSTFTPVIEASPYELTVYDALLLDQPRTFKIKWESNVTDKKFVTDGEGTGATIKEIENYLTDAGFSHNPKLVNGALSCMINTMITEDYAIIQQDIDNEGFYYNFDEDKLQVIKTDISEPTKIELLNAVEVLNKLSKYYTDNIEILATVFKWGLMSKFSYAMKQLGRWMPYLYLKGSAGSGKTTVGQLPLFIWNVETSENNIGGSSVETQARLGVKISKTCDPLTVNEPAGLFAKNAMVDMLKVCVESTTGRSKYSNTGRYRNYPAFSPILFTANMYLPEDDALLRRFYVLSFTYSLRKDESVKKRFENEFHITTPSISPLKSFNSFGRYVAREIIHEPSLLLEDWQDTINKILIDLFNDIEADCPDWLLSWASSETLEDFDDNQREGIRSFFNKEFNQARSRIKITDEYGNVKQGATLDIPKTSSGSDFESVNWEIVNSRLLPYALPYTKKSGKRYVCFNQSLRTALGKELNYCDSLKSIGELMGWDYATVRPDNNKKKGDKFIKVNFSDFMDFVYPNLELDDDGVD